MLNNIITESVRKHLPWQWWDSDACGLALQDVSKVFEVAIATADSGVFDVEGGDVGLAFNQVGGVHWAAGFGGVGNWVFDLEHGSV